VSGAPLRTPFAATPFPDIYYYSCYIVDIAISGAKTIRQDVEPPTDSSSGCEEAVMNRTGISHGALVHSLLYVLFLFFAACSDTYQDDRNEDTNQESPPVTAKDLQGTWFGVLETPYELSPGEFSDAWIFELGETDYKLVFYLDAVQVGGSIGTFEVGDGVLIIKASRSWNDTDQWKPDTGGSEVPFSLYPGALEIEGPNGRVLLKETVFARPDRLTGTWNDSIHTETMTHEGTGSYTFTGPPETPPTSTYTESGTWDATGTSAGFLRYETVTVGGAPFVLSYIIPYALSGTTLTLTAPDGDHVFR
jgi:hypothetical protein